jgi:hypothetical protein
MPTDTENACYPEYIGSRSAHRQNGAFDGDQAKSPFPSYCNHFSFAARLYFLVAGCIVLTESIWSDAGQKSRHRDWKR